MSPIVEEIGKHKNKALNILIAIIALFVAYRIYEVQAKKLAVLKEKSETETKKNAILDDISQIYQRINTLKKGVNSKDISTAINTIASMAKENSVKIISIRPQKEQPGYLYTKYPIELVVSLDSYHSLGKFISKLESHPDIYSVEVLEMKPQVFWQEGEADQKISVNILIYTILFKDL